MINEEKTATSNNFVNDLQNKLDQFEESRLTGLKNLKDFQVFSQALLSRESKRSSRKLGSNHPRVKQLETRLKDNLNFINEVEGEVEVARIKVPDVGDDDVLIHGRIVDEHNRGISGLSVFLENEGEKPLRSLGTADRPFGLLRLNDQYL